MRFTPRAYSLNFSNAFSGSKCTSLENRIIHATKAIMAAYGVIKNEAMAPMAKITAQIKKAFLRSILNLPLSYLSLSSLGSVLNPLINIVASSFNKANKIPKMANVAAIIIQTNTPVFIAKPS